MKWTAFNRRVAALLCGVLILALGGGAWAAENKGSDAAQIARGAKAWANTCSRCHNLRSPKELTDEDWEISVMHMRVRAKLPGNVAKDITAFLKAAN
jgi:hypothetical protein